MFLMSARCRKRGKKFRPVIVTVTDKDIAAYEGKAEFTKEEAAREFARALIEDYHSKIWKELNSDGFSILID